MDTQSLEAFIAVAETGSFSEAGTRIHLTQPAVSKRIAVLENQLNCRLFDRIARTVRLTESGLALLPRAQAIVQALDETRRTIRDISGQVAGSLSIAISHHIGLHRLPPVLKEFSSRHPAVALNVDFMDSEVAYDAVLQGQFEIAVITLAPSTHAKILAREIWPDPLQLIVADDHALARQTSVEIERLSDFRAILPDMKTYTGRMIAKCFTDRGRVLNAHMVTNYLETIKMMVSVGLGWSILPATMVQTREERGNLVAIKCKDLTLSRQLGYIHHRDKTLSNAATAFLHLLEGYGNV